jgi:hypothetical protein
MGFGTSFTLVAGELEQDDFNPFTGFVKQDGSIDIANTIWKPVLLITYILSIYLLIRGISGFVGDIFFCKQQKVLKELLQTPENELREKLLDMGFWLLAVPKNLQDTKTPQDEKTIEQLLAHFERKLPILTGQVVKETYTTTEKKIMDSMRDREEVTKKYYKHFTFYFFLGKLLGLGPYQKMEHGCLKWGPKPGDLEDRILQWRKSEEEEGEPGEV